MSMSRHSTKFAQKREQKLSLLSNGIFIKIFIVSTNHRQTEFVGKRDQRLTLISKNIFI